MLTVPDRAFLRRRPRRTPPAPPAPPAALAVVGVEDVVFGGDILTFTVVFNTTAGAPLASVAAADPMKWTARYDDALFVASGLTDLGFDRIGVETQISEADAGPDVLNYANAPSDVSDALGRQLAAFDGFPLA